MDLFIITGMSGAGKSYALKTMEDLGFYCIDNIPPSFIPQFVKMVADNKKIEKVALVADIRGAEPLENILSALNTLDEQGYVYKLIYLVASDVMLLKRYRETRRHHPMENDSLNTQQAIQMEREEFGEISKRADHVIDTSQLLTKEFKQELAEIVLGGPLKETLIITLVSYGVKYGNPVDCDLIFDLRFTPNPYYIDEMKEMTGKEKPVIEYVLGQKATQDFLKMLTEMIEFLIPLYIKEGKTSLVIGLGCTGGRHRSVVIADEFAKRLEKNKHRVTIQHRDIEKDAIVKEYGKR
ncbi:MAG TPA: RNase adapter RapZ [Clostridia bacterium]|nr:RNase adapter RapZ [Clostridia bacterium]HXK72753.1 RNase adapter RapZ [Clostridia bacterium]